MWLVWLVLVCAVGGLPLFAGILTFAGIASLFLPRTSEAPPSPARQQHVETLSRLLLYVLIAFLAVLIVVVIRTN